MDEVARAAGVGVGTVYRRLRAGSYGLYRRHLVALLDRIRTGADTAYLAGALLAPLAANLYRHQRHTQGMSVHASRTA